ncbi:MAG: exosome nuclease subunit [Alectoria sarmentosa]|nr:MAG: exosome nuclease subunit [Alectoria sarmentosa]
MALDVTFKDLQNSVSLALIGTTRTAGQISSNDLAFHRASNPSTVPLLEQQNSRLLGLARRLTEFAASGTEFTTPHIVSTDSVEDRWKEIVDVVDNLLEKADACLDEYSGIIRKLSPTQEEQIKKAAPDFGKQKPGKAYRTQNIAKPQLLFDKVPTNEETTPFKPSLHTKPNAIAALDESLKLVAAEDGFKQYNHPYEVEIKAFKYTVSTRVKTEPIPFLPYESSEATLVDTPETVLSMLEELKLAKEIAVDLEHHDEHSFVGLVSLMQISTRYKDWVIDTLKPWREKLQVLNEVFTDPKILKVFHGSSMDMIWLQRDFGLYVVGLFDTFHASRSLGYPKHGLAYLLKRYANFDAAKQFQMADWRIRPLPEKMFNYARSDTHFLLYVYDNMRNELIDKSDTSQEVGDLFEDVLKSSKEETLQRYERPFYDTQRGLGPMGWYNMLCRTPALFNREQFAVFRALHQWRDKVARGEDESVHFIMPKHVLYNLAREMPVDMPTLLGCSHPMSKSFKIRKSEIIAVIKKARILGNKGPDMKEFMSTMQPDRFSKANGAEQGDPALASAKRATPPQLQRNLKRLPPQSRNSRFWGSTVPKNMDRGPIAHIPGKSPCLALPMPRLTAEILEDKKSTANANERSQTSSGALAEHQYVKDRKRKAGGVFVVKEAGGPCKRKATVFYDPPDAIYSRPERNATDNALKHADEIDTPPNIENEEQQDQNTRILGEMKEEKRARRLEGKRLKEEFRGDEDAKSQIPREAEPFDYANAPSVLHAQRNSNRTVPGKEINPYAKSSDAPKGVRKTEKEHGGKSFTFKG